MSELPADLPGLEAVPGRHTDKDVKTEPRTEESVEPDDSFCNYSNGWGLLFMITLGSPSNH